MPEKISLSGSERDILIGQIVNQAATAPLAIGAKGYMAQLIHKTNWPPKQKTRRVGALTGVPDFDALELVRWALGQGTNPDDKNYTFLGGLAEVLIGDVGLEDARSIATLIAARGLYRDPGLQARLRMRYQIPLPAPELADAAKGAGLGFGPKFDWLGPDDIELQSKVIELKKRAVQFTGEFLIQAAQRAYSVCKIEVDLENQQGEPIGTRFGTGVLIAPRLVLTNYHNLKDKKKDYEDIEKNAHNTVVRFGDYKADVGNEVDGQTFDLDPADDGSPILESSPEDELDFVLLQVESEIENAEIEPVTIADPTYVPSKKSALHLVHHPGGKEMMVDFSPNGVTAIKSDIGKIQYYTWAMQGSSGAPCFDDDWQLVAIHHAEVTEWAITRREGILFASIYEKIKGRLA